MGEIMGVVPQELPPQVFRTLAIRFGTPPTRAAGTPGILSGAVAAMEYTGNWCYAIATEMAVPVGGRFGYKWVMFGRIDKRLCHLGPNHQFESPLVGRSVPNCELFAGKSLYEEPLGNTGLGPRRSLRPSEPDLEGD